LRTVLLAETWGKGSTELGAGLPDDLAGGKLATDGAGLEGAELAVLGKGEAGVLLSIGVELLGMLLGD
jgi:hypothetical protein